MHFASYTLVGESMQKPLLYLRDNLVAGANLLERAVDHGVGRFILSSTANLFDDPTTMPIEPDDRIVPGSPYGESKFFLERTLHWFERIHGLKYACLRYFNASGDTPHRGEHHNPETHLIPRALDAARGHAPALEVYGRDYPTPDGTCIRDYVHVTDLASAHIDALEYLNRGNPSASFNLGTGAGCSVLEVVRQVAATTGCEVPLRFQPRRVGDPPVLVADSARASTILGWRPRHSSLEEIVESAWSWHQRDSELRSRKP